MKSLAFALALLLVPLVPTLAHADEAPVPAEEPPAPQPAPAEAPPKPPRSVPIGIRVDGGYALRTLEKLPLNGADIGVAIGAQPGKHFAMWGGARLFLGSTESGLGVKSGRFNMDFDLVIDRLRIEIEPGIFIVGVDRATRNQTIVGWGPKIGLGARFDVLQADAFAIFIRAAVEGGPTFSDGSFFGGATFGAGIDFDIKRGDRSTL